MRTRFHLSLLTLLVSVGCILAFSTSLQAQDLDGILGNMAWGINHKVALEVIEEEGQEAFRIEAEETPDTYKRDRLRKKYEVKHKRIVKGYKQLKKGVRTGLEVSIVNDEFAKDNGESFFKVRDENATRYFFFANDQLYKVSVAYNPTYIQDTPFMDFLGSVAYKYGEQTDLFENEIGNIVAVYWDLGDTNLHVKDRTLAYSAFLMTFSDAELEATVADAQIAARALRAAGPTSNVNLDSLVMGDSSEDSFGSASSADNLLGEDNSFDLRGTLSAEEAKILDEMNKKPEEEKKKAQKAKRKRRKKKTKLKKKSSSVLIY